MHSLLDAEGWLAFLAEASKKAGVHIIASTGFHKLEYYDETHWIFSKDVDSLARLFIEEIENGMYLDGDEQYPCKQTEYKAE